MSGPRRPGKTLGECIRDGIYGDREYDPPLIAFDVVVGWIRNALAVVGALALAAAFGLWRAGFFAWIGERMS